MNTRYLLSAVLLWFAITPLRAQTGTGTLTGQVTDPSGAMVPHISVLVVNTETNFTFSTETNDAGLFRVASLQPGTYRITYEGKGFKRLVRDNIMLRTGNTLEVSVALEIGQVTESLDVSAALPLLATESSAAGTIVDGKTLYALPMYQRYINATSYLVPGVTMQSPSSGETLGAIHIAGGRSTAIGVFADGTSGNDPMTGTVTLRPIQSAVAEVNVLTTTLPAEYGHSAGGVITSVSKTGTNMFHGMVSAYGRWRSMQHKNYFDVNRTSDPRPFLPNGTPVMFLQPDAYGGGPLVIPKLYNGRNKTFWFVAYQKLIDKQTKQFSGTTPTAAMKGGDFTFGGRGAQIYDPFSTTLTNGVWTRTPVPGNTIPLNRIDPVAAKILAMNPWVDPSPGFGSFASTGPSGNLIYNQRGQAYYEDYQGRIDHQFTSNVKLYGSYLYNHEAGPGWETNLYVPVFDGTNGNQTPLTVQNYSSGLTWIFGPRTLNDVRAGYQRYRNDKFVPSYGQNWAQQLGIPNVDPALMPAFGSGNQFLPDSIYGLTVSGPSRQIGEVLSFRDDLTKSHGVHAFKLGFELMRFRENSSVTNLPSGQFLFDTMTAGLQANGQPVPNTGNTFAGFEFGAVRQATFDQQIANWLPRDAIVSAYIQDDWKISPRLTLNLGLRYMNESPFHTKYNVQSNFDPTAIDRLTGKTGSIVNPPGNLNARDNNNFQPRVGMAWHPLKRWVLRGGFAVNTVDVKFPVARGQFDNYVAQAVQQQLPGDPRPLYRLSQGPNPLQFNISNGNAVFVGTNYSGRNVSWWDPAMRNPYVLNWNTTLEYALSANYLLSVIYQGSAGIGLVENWNLNTMPVDFGASDPALRAAAFAASQNYRPFPQFGNITMLSNFGHSTYHAGSVKVEKRYSQGLAFTGSYTFSKTIDSQDTNTSGSGVAPIQNRALEKAKAAFSRTDVVVASATYELPMGRGKRFFNNGGAWKNYVFGGYDVAWIQTFQTGLPITFTYANSPFNYFPTYAGDRRPNLTCTPSMYSDWEQRMASSGDRYTQANINAVMSMSCFGYPAAFTPGNSGRNIVTGPGLIGATLSAKKTVVFRERYQAQIRLDMNNPFKFWAFANPTNSVDSVNPQLFGKITSVPQTSPGAFGGAPLMNLSLKLFW